MYRYDHTTDTWTIVPNITLPARNYIACAVTNKKACLYGGQDSLNVITNDIKLFDPVDTSLTTFAGIPTIGRKGTMVFVLNDVFYVTTGLDATQNRIKETWKNTAFVGINENKNISTQVYPNPANDKLNFVLNAFSEATIHLFNEMGESIIETKIIGGTEINTESLVNGLYFLVIRTKEGLCSQKIIIMH